MDRLAVWAIHDPPFGKAECLLIKGGCRFHIGHRQHCRYRTVELFIERIDFSGHNTPFVRRVSELNFSRSCSSCTARRNFLAAEIENTLKRNVRSTCFGGKAHVAELFPRPRVADEYQPSPWFCPTGRQAGSNSATSASPVIRPELGRRHHRASHS